MRLSLPRQFLQWSCPDIIVCSIQSSVSPSVFSRSLLPCRTLKGHSLSLLQSFAFFFFSFRRTRNLLFSLVSNPKLCFLFTTETSVDSERAEL